MKRKQSLPREVLLRNTNRALKESCEELTNHVVQAFLMSLNTPVALSVWLCWKYKQHDQIASKRIDPLQYNDGDLFGRELAAVSLLRKYIGLETGSDPGAVAFGKFKAAEFQCRDTNLRLRHRSGRHTAWFDRCLSVAARKIDNVLGKFSVEEWLDSCGFGPGVTLGLKGADATLSNKFGSKFELAPALHAVLSRELFSLAYPRWGLEAPIQKVDGNVLTTVLKNAEEDRFIGIEPSGNLWFQKGIGTMIRRRLKTVGVDLDDQTNNQWYARKGAITGDWATVDFSSASDTVSRAIVEELIPHEWFRLMELTRSRCGTFKTGTGKESQTVVFDYHKFSSMGNGFTFELESLIFWALAKSVTDDKVLVYGDDVIISSKNYPEFASLSDFCGFTVNRKKSYSSGYFRESCGSYYWGERSVKPYFLKERLSNVSQLYAVANALRELADRLHVSDGFRSAWLLLYHAVPEGLRLHVPAGIGDCGFVVPLDVALAGHAFKVRRLTGQKEGYGFVSLRECAKTTHTDKPGLLLARLKYPSRQMAFKNAEMPRGRISLRFATETTPHWYNSEAEASIWRTRFQIARELEARWLANEDLFWDSDADQLAT